MNFPLQEEPLKLPTFEGLARVSVVCGWFQTGTGGALEGDKIERNGGLLFTQRVEYVIFISLFPVNCLCRQVSESVGKRCRPSRGAFL